MKKDDSLDLAEVVIKNVNESSKSKIPIATYLNNPDAAVHIKDWIPTGCDILDLAVSNRKNGGLPVGRVVEIFGLEGSGKSLLCAYVLAETQKKGGIAVLIDTEAATSKDFFSTLGVDVDKLIIMELNVLEEIYEATERVIESVRKSQKDVPVTIVIDSLAGASTKMEMEATYDRQGYATGKALINSTAMRKITNLIAKEKILLIGTNQVRANMNAMGFGAEAWTTSGGKAWPFHASVRIKLKLIGKENSGDEIQGSDKTGRKVEAEIVKNRVGPPLRKVKFNIYFDRGIDNYESWLFALKEMGVVTTGGAWYTYKHTDPETGEEREAKFLKRDFDDLLASDPSLREHMYNAICDTYIMEYKPKKVEEKQEEKR